MDARIGLANHTLRSGTQPNTGSSRRPLWSAGERSGGYLGKLGGEVCICTVLQPGWVITHAIPSSLMRKWASLACGLLLFGMRWSLVSRASGTGSHTLCLYVYSRANLHVPSGMGQFQGFDDERTSDWAGGQAGEATQLPHFARRAAQGLCGRPPHLRRWSTGPGTVYSLLRVEEARLFRVQCRPCTDPCKTHVGKILAVPIFAVPPSDGISRYVCANALPTHGSHAHVRPSVLPRSSAHVDAVLP